MSNEYTYAYMHFCMHSGDEFYYEDYDSGKQRENFNNWILEKHTETIEKNTRILKIFDLNNKTCLEYTNYLFRRISKNGVMYASNRYCRLENLPAEYGFMAINRCQISDVIELNIGNFFKSIQELSNFNKKINELTNEKNKAYNKVTEVQRAIHNQAIAHGSHDSHLHLCKDSMRKILSYARLYFLIRESESFKIGDLHQKVSEIIQYKINSEVEEECLYAQQFGKKHIPKWKIRYQNTIYFYFKKKDRIFLKELMKGMKCEDKELLFNSLLKNMPETDIL